MNTKTMRMLGLLFSIAVAGNCASMVNKERAKQVKKIAIVTATANSGPYQRGGGSSLTQMAAVVSNATGSDALGDFGGNRLVTRAYKGISSRIPGWGWQVIAEKEVLKKPAYEEFKKALKEAEIDNELLRKLANSGQQVPTGFPNYNSKSHGTNEKVKAALNKLAKDLGVDAIAFVDLDIYYGASFAIGGTGVAKAKASLSLNVQDQQGEWIIRMQPAAQTEYFSGDSDGSTALVGGNIPFTDGTEKLYNEAIDEAIKKMDEGLLQKLK
jgi:hypothetical protein